MISRFMIGIVLTVFSTSVFAQDYIQAPLDNARMSYSESFQIDRHDMQEFLGGSVTLDELAHELQRQGAPISQQPIGLLLHRSFDPQEDSRCQEYCYTDSKGNRVCRVICGNNR